jgi:hypothetical protein
MLKRELEIVNAECVHKGRRVATLDPKSGVSEPTDYAGAVSMSMAIGYSTCEKLKKELENVKAECMSKGRRIATLDIEAGRLRAGGLSLVPRWCGGTVRDSQSPGCSRLFADTPLRFYLPRYDPRSVSYVP